MLLNGGTFRVDYVGAQTSTFAPTVGERYVFDCLDNMVTINGTRYRNDKYDKSTAALKEMYIFNENNNGSLVSQAKMRLYSAAVWLDGTVLSANYVPCVKDGFAGLYNTVDGSILYGVVTNGLVASEAVHADYRVNAGAVETKFTIAQSGMGGTTEMAGTSWAATGASVTLTATPESGNVAIWLVTDSFGNSTTLKGSSVNCTVPATPTTVTLSFAPDGVLTPVDDIYAAIAAAEAGSTINLSAGTFALTNTLALAKGITLKGAGADLTILKMPTTGDFTAVNISHADAVLEGVAITGVYFTSRPSVAASGSTYNSSGQAKDGTPFGVKLSAGTFRNSVVRDNYATLQYGYGPWTYMTGGTVDNVQYLDNYYYRTGNAVNGYALRTSGGVITNSVFARNGCNWEQYGVVWMTAGTIVDSELHHNNAAASYYAGLYLNGSGAKAERCRIYNNANGLYVGNGTVVNCLIYNNGKAGNAGYYAGVRQAGGNLYYCTVFGNVTEADPDGRSGLHITSGTAKNNIIFGNGPAGTKCGSVLKTGGTFEYNLTDLAVAGTGNAVGTPSFTDAASGDFTLKLGSAAAGIGTAISGYTTDFVQTARAAMPSAGAYEFVPGSSLACGIQVDQAIFKEGAAATVTAVVEGATDPTYAWYVDDVLSSETSATPSFSGLSAGSHTIKLVVTDGANSVESTFANAVTVKPAVVYVATDTTPAYPYSTPTTAANSILEALDAVYSDAETAGRVNVAEGRYEETGTILLAAPLEVVGAGRDATVISGIRFTDKGRGAYLSHAKALLKDLTITGCTNQSHGVGVYMTQGTLNNVHVTRSYQKGSGDNYNHGAGVLMENGVITNSLIDYCYLNANYHGSQGIGVWMSGGTLVDSEVSNNWMTRTQHNGIGIYAKGGVVTRCRIHDNYSTANSTGGSGVGNVSSGHGINMSGSTIVEDCHIYSNGWNGVMITGGTLRNSLIFGHRKGTADYFAGVNLAGGTLLNCTITDNYAAGDTNGKSGLWMTGGTAINNIVYGNGKAELGSSYVTGGTFRTNILDKATAYASAIDTIVSDPKFVSAYDFHVQNGSPAIDAGAPLLDHDLDGIVRPQRGGYDIGCYELEPSTERTVSISAAQTVFKAGSTIFAQATTENIDISGATFSWTLKGPDGTVVNTQSGTGDSYAEYAFANAPVGTNTLTLVVTDGGDDLPADAPVVFSLKPITAYVSLEGSNTEPYDTQEKAARSVNDAFAAIWQATDVTSTVYIAAGEYRMTDSLGLMMPVRIFGAGLDVTVLNGSAIPATVNGLTVNHDDALVKDLTLDGCTNNITWGSSVRLYKGMLDSVRITRGYSRLSEPNGVGLYQTGGVATNCIIDRCGSGTGYGWAYGVGIKMTGGLFTDGQILDNILNRYEHHGAAVRVDGGTLRRTLMRGNRGDYGSNSYGAVNVAGSGVIEDCTIIGPGRGNGVYVEGGTIRNSLVTGYKETTKVGSYAAGGLTLWSGKVINCTIVSNVTTVAEMSADPTQTGGTIRNSIASEATLAGGTQDHNIFNTDPKFRNPAKGDFRLANDSPAINAGDNGAWDWGDPEEALDLQGLRRVSQDTIDCGCYEYNAVGFLLYVR